MDTLKCYPIDDETEDIIEEEILTLRPLTFDVEPNFRGRERENIHMWCFKKDSDKRVLVRIANFPTIGCFELPSCTFDTQEPIYWDLSSVNKVFKYFSFCMKLKNKTQPLSFSFEEKDDIQDYSFYKKKYIYMYFLDTEPLKSTTYMCSKERNIMGVGLCKFTPHEVSVNSLRRLMSMRDCKYNQWFNITVKKVPANYGDRASISTLDEYFGNWKTLCPIEESLTTTWHVTPSIFVWDIETYSDNHRAMPSAFNLTNCIYLISIVFQYLGRPETKKEFVIIYGECNPIEGVILVKVKSELEGLTKFAQILRFLNPDIISGYNIFGYDYDYFINRFKVALVDIPPMGRLLESKAEIYDKSWKSSGYGKNMTVFIIVKGMIPADLYPNVKRLIKLRKYTLQFVGMYTVGKGKNDVTAQEMFRTYEACQKIEDNGLPSQKNIGRMTEVTKYCVVDSELVLEIFEKINLWHHLLELSGITGTPILDLFIRGEQVRWYSQIYNECYKRNFVLSIPRQFDFYYSGAHVNTPIVGLHEYVNTFDFKSLYPSIMQAYNLCYTTFLPKELWGTVADEDCHIFEFYQDEPEDYVSVNREEYELYDLNKLVTKSEVKNNLDYGEEDGDFYEEVYNNDKDKEDEDDDDEEKEDNKKGTVRKFYEFRVVRPHVRVGIMPTLEKDCVDERNKVRAYKKIIDKNLKNGVYSGQELKDKELESIVLDKRQLGIKIFANSGYGFLGAKKGYLPGIPLAMIVCAMGRKLIKEANLFFVDNYKHYNARTAYGDTDSTMVSIDLPEGADTHAIGEEMSLAISGCEEKRDKDGNITQEAITGIFDHSVLFMEFEDCSRAFFAKKKMYAKAKRGRDSKFQLDDDGNIIVESKGMLTAKRGKSKYSMDVFNDKLSKIINRDTKENTLISLTKHILSLMRGELNPAEKLTMVSELGADYKNETYFMCIFAGNLCRGGNPVKAGDRVEYVVVRIPKEDENILLKGGLKHKIYLGDKCREITLWEKDPNREEIDYSYYISRGLQKPYDFNFLAAFNDITHEKYAHISYKPRFSQCKAKHISKPILMIEAFVKDFVETTDEQFYAYIGRQYDPKIKKIRIIADLLEIFMNNVINTMLSIK